MKKGGLTTAGFTVVETMIVLAVTGILFVSIMLLINGRAGKAQFADAVNTLQLSLQQTIGQVQSGYYPNSGFTCTSAPGGVPQINPPAAPGNSTQGTNKGCIFVGKVVQFALDNTGSHDTTSPDIAIYSLAGTQKLSTGGDVTTLAEARPIAIAPSTTRPGTPSATEAQELRYGLAVQSMRYVDSGSTVQIGAFAIVTSFQPTIPHGSELESGSQQINIVPLRPSQLGLTGQTMVDAINSRLGSSPVNPSGGVQICLKSGTTSNQWGIITVGGAAGAANVNLKIKQGGSCW